MPNNLTSFRNKLSESQKKVIAENMELSDEAYRKLEDEFVKVSQSPSEPAIVGIFRILNPEYRNLQDILQDNPGLGEAITNWIMEQLDGNPEWVESVENWAGDGEDNFSRDHDDI